MTKYNLYDLIKDDEYKNIDKIEYIYLKENLIKLKINFEEDDLKNLIYFKNLLKIVNKTVNLTAIKDDNELLIKHFIDSFFIQEYLKEEDKNIIDIGTGAGFPGLCLAIINKDKNFLLVDSVSKKIEFLKMVVKLLKLKNVECVSERFEDLGNKLKEKFDIVLCRGVAHLSVIMEYSCPFLKVNKRFLPQKLTLDEVNEIKNSLNIFNYKILSKKEFKLPNGDLRYIIEMKKEKNIGNKFPRANGLAKKKPYF